MLSFLASIQPTARGDRTAFVQIQMLLNSNYVRDVTQGEDACRIRTPPLIQIWALARNFALNLYRAQGFQNMAQAQRRAGFSLNTLMDLFRMK